MRVIYLIIAAVQLPIHTIGTLTHTMLFPHVVEVSSETSSVNNITDETIRLSFGTRKFSCSDPTDESEFVDESLDSIPLLEKIVSLDGMCWTVPTDETSRRFYRVCIGKDIHLLDVRDSSRKRSPSHVARTDPIRKSKLIPGGIEEVHEGSDALYRVQYLCDRDQWIQSPAVRLVATIHITIQSYLFCSSLSDVEIRSLVEALPALGFGTEETFWRYHYRYPNFTQQSHVDSTGATPIETFLLGNNTGSELRFSSKNISSTDPQNLSLQTVLEYMIEEGDFCHREGIHRRSVIQFRCPDEWEELSLGPKRGWTQYRATAVSRDKLFFARIKSVDENDYCEYTFVVESTALCIDSRLVPKLLGLETAKIQCLLESR